jgi:hypothetical protein
MWKVNDSLLALVELFTIIVLPFVMNIFDIFYHFNVRIFFSILYLASFESKPNGF